jgi:hypothetical protein
LLDRLIASPDVGAEAEAGSDAVANGREKELESGSSQAMPARACETTPRG